jgi:hypothetical protein
MIGVTTALVEGVPIPEIPSILIVALRYAVPLFVTVTCETCPDAFV